MISLHPANPKDHLLAYVPIANFIARMNGSACEAVIHDASDPAHSVLYITTPNITGRVVGDGMTDYALGLISSRRWLREEYVVNYLGSSSERGRVFRSSTYFIRSADTLHGLLCVNVDIGPLVRARALIEEAMLIEPKLLGGGEQLENFNLSPEEIIESTVQKYAGNLPVAMLPTENKRRLVCELKERGIFLLKGTISCVAQRLGVSDQTVYRYIKEFSHREDGDPDSV